MSTRVLIVTPVARGSRQGNRITAERWARILRQLGCRVRVAQGYREEACDVLLALHARKSARAVARFHEAHPKKPLLLALTGTDLYADLRTHATARRSLDLATRLIVLQADAVNHLPRRHRAKSRVIYQSTTPPGLVRAPRKDRFEVCVVGHLRSVKDPFRAALAVRRLPSSSRVHLIHIGGSLSAAMERRARREEDRNARYHWLGEMSPEHTKRRLASCRLLVLSSRLEGGANVISEALIAGVPVLASRISGSIGMLGEDYPGYFQVGDTRGLADLLWRAETDASFLSRLRRVCAARRPLFSPAHEQASWRALLEELSF